MLNTHTSASPPSTNSLIPTLEESSLLTDLYELTMAACYTGEGLDQRKASFELFVRRLPDGFSYLIAMGLEQVLDYLDAFQFNEAQIQALQASGVFAQAPDRFWSLLESARFTGDVWAVPEGTAMFAHEPLLRIEAPLWQAQILETYLLNTLNYQTLIATRAAQMRDVVGADAKLLEFGSRRAFSPQASLWAARAALAAGFDGTSNVLAALKLGQAPRGTMAHALVMALSAVNGSEDDAFTAFHRYFPGAALLIDTYDVESAAQRLAAKVNAGEMTVEAVRLDSGDLVKLSKMVRSLLPHTQIFASGDLDAKEITRLKTKGAILNGYGIGTKLVTGSPVNGVYKLVDLDGIPTMKGATGKVTYPGRKQVFRHLDPYGQWQSDRLALMAESSSKISSVNIPSANIHSSNDRLEDPIPLLEPFMKDGQRLTQPESLEAIAQRTQTSVAQLPASLRQVNSPAPPSPIISDALQDLTDQTRQRIQTQYIR
ncbi:MAG: nicotinate phosphoribosyltransferase [Cyanobacteria bacterium P01_F01_bin.150]